MNEISKIIIKSSSGYHYAEEAYSDKIAVTEESIVYEYIPMVETKINPSRKWLYETTSPIFKKLYTDLVKTMPLIVNLNTCMFCEDTGAIEFIITYADKTKFKETFFLPGEEFKECFQIIKRMVPECEYVPAVLITEADHEY